MLQLWHKSAFFKMKTPPSGGADFQTIKLHGWYLDTQLTQDGHQASALGGLHRPGGDFSITRCSLSMLVRRFEGFPGSRDDTHVHRGQIEISVVGAAQFTRDVSGVLVDTFDIKTVVEVWECSLQTSTDPHPFLAADRFGHRPAEFEIAGEVGFCFLEITHLDGVHQGLNSCFCIHKNFLYL